MSYRGAASFALFFTAISLILLSVVFCTRAIAQSACVGVPWGSPENYSTAGAAGALAAVTELLAAAPAGAPLEGTALRDAKALLHEASDHIEQIINHFALITTPRPACWRCNPYVGTVGPPATPSAYAVATMLNEISDLVYGPAQGITGGDKGIQETIESWGPLPACTAEQIAAVDGRAPTAKVEVAYCSLIPGLWSWFVNGDVDFRGDGSLQQGQITGRWSCNNQNRRVSIVWSHGFTDELELSADGAHMQGTNNTGNAVTGHKKAPAKQATPPAGRWWYVQCGGDSMRTPMGPPAGDRWMGSYQLSDGSPGWIFDLQRGGNGWSGTGYRFNDPRQQKSGCNATERPEG
jgi:hypothetical protein